MRITVITVCFNSAGTLGDALASVAAQQGVEVEHLIIDGGSTDGTQDVVARFPHVARLVSERDNGIYDAMNKGLSLATGDVVGFLNADDMLAGNDVLSHVVAALAAEPSADAAYGDLIYVSHADVSRLVRDWRSGTFKRSRLAFGWMPPHPTFYARRQVLQEVGGFDTRLRIAADYDLMLRVLTRPQARAVYVPRVLVKMRTGGASNRSLRALWRKSSEDLRVMRANRVGGWGTLFSKNLRKVPQFLSRSKP